MLLTEVIAAAGHAFARARDLGHTSANYLGGRLSNATTTPIYLMAGLLILTIAIYRRRQKPPAPTLPVLNVHDDPNYAASPMPMTPLIIVASLYGIIWFCLMEFAHALTCFLDSTYRLIPLHEVPKPHWPTYWDLEGIHTAFTAVSDRLIWELWSTLDRYKEEWFRITSSAYYFNPWTYQLTCDLPREGFFFFLKRRRIVQFMLGEALVFTALAIIGLVLVSACYGSVMGGKRYTPLLFSRLRWQAVEYRDVSVYRRQFRALDYCSRPSVVTLEGHSHPVLATIRNSIMAALRLQYSSWVGIGERGHHHMPDDISKPRYAHTMLSFLMSRFTKYVLMCYAQGPSPPVRRVLTGFTNCLIAIRARLQQRFGFLGPRPKNCVVYHMLAEMIPHLRSGDVGVAYQFLPTGPAGRWQCPGGTKADYIVWHTDDDGVTHASVSGGARYQHTIRNFRECDRLVFTNNIGQRLLLQTERRDLEGPFTTIFYTVTGTVLDNHVPLLPAFIKLVDANGSNRGQSLWVGHELVESDRPHCVYHLAHVNSSVPVATPDYLLDTVAAYHVHQLKVSEGPNFHRILTLTANTMKSTPDLIQLAAYHLMNDQFRDIIGLRRAIPSTSEKQTFATLSTNAIDGQELPKEVGTTIVDHDSNMKFHDRGHVASQSAVCGRVQATSQPFFKLPDLYKPVLKAFKAFIRPAAKLFPLYRDEVLESASNAQRRKYVDATEVQDPQATVKAFQKSEAQKPGAIVRNISGVDPAHVFQFLCFVLPMAAHLKSLGWYAFGQKFEEIGLKVMELANRAKTLVSTDFSKFDGTQSYCHSMLLEQIMLDAYHFSFHTCIKQLFAALREARCFTTEGMEYDHEGTKLSGSADTSLGNTILNAFVAFAAASKQYGIAQAHKYLGLYGGDDGLSLDIDTDIYNSVASDLGFKLKAEATQSHEPITFLGRYFPYPLSSPHHTVDLRRCGLKVYVSPHRGMDPWLLLCYKAAGLKATDYSVPFIKSFVDAVERNAPAGYVRKAEKHAELSYLAKVAADTGYRPQFDYDIDDILANQVSRLPSGLDGHPGLPDFSKVSRLEDFPAWVQDVPEPYPEGAVYSDVVSISSTTQLSDHTMRKPSAQTRLARRTATIFAGQRPKPEVDPIFKFEPGRGNTGPTFGSYTFAPAPHSDEAAEAPHDAPASTPLGSEEPILN